MYTDFAAVLIFIIFGALFIFGSLLLGALVRPKRKSIEKDTVYECGEPTIGPSWIRFNSRFYTIALVYLLFDVEVVVLLPAALVLKEMKIAGYGATALIGLMIFLSVLTLGLAYEWYWGNLDWIRKTDENSAAEGAALTRAIAEDEPEAALVGMGE